MYDLVKTIVVAFVLPPGGPVTLVTIGSLAWRKSPRVGRALCGIGAAFLWLSSTPLVAAALVTMLGGAVPLDMGTASRADAIVILGGGVRQRAVEFGGDTLGRLTLERTRYGAFVARSTGLPILVTGGSPKAGVQSEARLMRDALANEYGLEVRWVEDAARNTREAASKVSSLLSAGGVNRVVLVTHGFDVRRSRRLFEGAGLKVLPAPTWVPRWDTAIGAGDFLPSAAALNVSFYSLYEVMAEARDLILPAGAD